MSKIWCEGIILVFCKCYFIDGYIIFFFIYDFFKNNLIEKVNSLRNLERKFVIELERK